MDVLSPFISILCHSDWLFYREYCPRLDVVYPGRAWSSSPACTWHCSLHYFFLQAIPLLWSPYVIGQTIIFSSCSFFLLSSSFFSRLISAAAHWMSTILRHIYGVALVRIENAGLKRAARGSLEMQDSKNCQKLAICAPSHNFVGLYLRNEGTYRQSEKNLLVLIYPPHVPTL